MAANHCQNPNDRSRSKSLKRTKRSYKATHLGDFVLLRNLNVPVAYNLFGALDLETGILFKTAKERGNLHCRYW